MGLHFNGHAGLPHLCWKELIVSRLNVIWFCYQINGHKMANILQTHSLVFLYDFRQKELSLGNALS